MKHLPAAWNKVSPLLHTHQLLETLVLYETLSSSWKTMLVLYERKLTAAWDNVSPIIMKHSPTVWSNVRPVWSTRRQCETTLVPYEGNTHRQSKPLKRWPRRRRPQGRRWRRWPYICEPLATLTCCCRHSGACRRQWRTPTTLGLQKRPPSLNDDEDDHDNNNNSGVLERPFSNEP